MENIVEQEAVQFSKLFFQGRDNKLEKLKSRLTNKLFNFNKDKDRLFFLNVLRKEIERKKIEHEQTCKNPNCVDSEEKSIGLFVIDQEIDDISENYEYIPKPEDEFSTQERVDLHNKLNLIAEKLEEMGLGQEVIFEEIESLKENFNLGKKNWFQFLKGKLFDLAIKKVLDETIINNLYKELSDGYEIVKGMIGN